MGRREHQREHGRDYLVTHQIDGFVGRAVVSQVCTGSGNGIQPVVGEAIPSVVREAVGGKKTVVVLYSKLLTSRPCPGIP